MLWDWEAILARDAQLPPPDPWRVWLVLAGRGWGKTRTAVQWVHSQAMSGRAGRIAIVGRTAGDLRDTAVEGPSGLLTVTPPHERPVHQASRRRLVWPNGAVAITYTAEEPDQLRGPNHDAAWADELAAWSCPDAWDMLQFGLRIGEAKCVVTTTPRPTPLIRDLLVAPGTVVTRGVTDENAANLSPVFLEALARRYAGTRLERQERFAEVLTDTPGALWTLDVFHAHRVRETPPVLRRVVVAVDPATGTGEGSTETGIVAAGLAADGQAYVLADHSGQLSPAAWGERAVALFDALRADAIVGEVNQGGDMVAHVVESAVQTMARAGRRPDGMPVPFRAVRASRGKAARAEPIAALYEQGRVHHVGHFPELEDQCSTWSPDSGAASPDRMDALVWALTELFPAMHAAPPTPAQLVRSDARPAW